MAEHRHTHAFPIFDPVNFGPYDADADAPKAPADWHISFACENQTGLMVTTASVSRVDQIVCLLITAGPPGPEKVVRQLLVRKARMWVAEYLMRPHSGETGFGSLPV